MSNRDVWVQAFAEALHKLQPAFELSDAKVVGQTIYPIHGQDPPEQAAKKYPFTSPPPPTS